MGGNHSDFHGFTDHEHQKIPRLETLRQKFGMPGEIKFFTLDVVFIDGRSNQRVNPSVLKIGNCPVKRHE